MTERNWIWLVIFIAIGIIVYFVSPPNSPRASYAIAVVGVIMLLLAFTQLGGLQMAPLLDPTGRRAKGENPPLVGDDLHRENWREKDGVAQKETYYSWE